MKKLLVIVPVAGVLYWWVLWRARDGDGGSYEEGVAGKAPTETTIEAPEGPLMESNPFFTDYGNPLLPEEADVAALELVLQDVFLLIKDFDRFHLPGNPEIVKFLQGSNPDKLKWLPKEHPLIGKNGELMDRHGVPVFFHRLGGTEIRVRTAGEDGRLWTDDDVTSE